MSENIIVTKFSTGPYVIVVTDKAKPDDDAFPMVVAPKGGFSSTTDAVRYIQDEFANRATPYLGLTFHIAPLRSLQSFSHFCSWED